MFTCEKFNYQVLRKNDLNLECNQQQINNIASFIWIRKVQNTYNWERKKLREKKKEKILVLGPF